MSIADSSVHLFPALTWPWMLPDLTIVIRAIANTVAQIKCGHAGFLCALSSGNFDVHITDSSQQVHRISNCWLVHCVEHMPSYQDVSHPSICRLVCLYSIFLPSNLFTHLSCSRWRSGFMWTILLESPSSWQWNRMFMCSSHRKLPCLTWHVALNSTFSVTDVPETFTLRVSILAVTATTVNVMQE